MHAQLGHLHPYPFEKLAQLFADITPPENLTPILFSIGEPKHESPAFVRDVLVHSLDHLSSYPTTHGILPLRETIAAWLCRRFNLSNINPGTQILPVNGTREALFSGTQAIINQTQLAQKPYVVMPNPFYQIYEGATLIAGATPYLFNTSAENNFLGDFDAIPEHIWQQTQLLFICTPGNPTGAVLPEATLIKLIALADRYDFVIASDECYSEIYSDIAPVGLLQACAAISRDDFARCLVFHSLSKRSNLPGLRSGFVAGDAHLIAPFLRYRTYHGCAMPIQHQLASIAAWNDEAHVAQNRQLYQQKFDLMREQLSPQLALKQPDAGFYFWLPAADDLLFARKLYSEAHITVLPGRFLSRDTVTGNPGVGYVRMAMVPDMTTCQQAITRMRSIREYHA